jgi:hypothetical protein
MESPFDITCEGRNGRSLWTLTLIAIGHFPKDKRQKSRQVLGYDLSSRQLSFVH